MVRGCDLMSACVKLIGPWELKLGTTRTAYRIYQPKQPLGSAKIIMVVKASFEYAQRQSPDHEGEKYYTLSYIDKNGFPQSNFEYDTIGDITIQDMRSKQFALEDNGIEIVPFHSRLKHGDYDDTAMVEGSYLNEVSSFLQKKTGAKHVFIFEYLVRNWIIGYTMLES